MAPSTGIRSTNETPFHSLGSPDGSAAGSPVGCERAHDASGSASGCYFAYGSNMSSARLAARVPSARSQVIACLRDWRLAFDKPGRDGTGKANLVSAAGRVVWGVAYTLDPAEWEVLDRFEPGYRRVGVRCERPDGTPLDAVTYVFGARDGGGRRDLAPSDEYLGYVIAGAQEHGLPAAYLESILDALRGRG